MSRIHKKFVELRRRKKKAFIAFITAGYPSLTKTKQLVLAFEKVGVDIVELGVPFSDPMADGPIIQEASAQALRNKVTLASILKLVKEIRASSSIPICLMTYYNPIFCFGEKKFCAQASACGVDGVIIPDLPAEEASSLRAEATRHGIDVICFIAPTTTQKRMHYLVSIAQGFIYYVSLAGVTGPRARLPVGIQRQVGRIRACTRKPVCVGFGVSHRGQVKQIARMADGVIVGSAIVRMIKQYSKAPDCVKRVSALVGNLAKDI
ncbi:MAG: tryptophan synthase subunit alpha [Candidatus Omnitrophica bacterium]|nr:tryptophan synthase subunit alpha [Candidatus Omnitrophota bacterium]